jgi:cytoskeletal protein CcmA (bactofilin family)
MDGPGIGWVQRQMGRQDSESVDEPESRRSLTTFIDQGADFEGTLRLRATFRIDGEFRGEIVGENTVIVGQAAGLQANIRAREVIIGGAVVGNVSASRQLILRAGGRLHGDVETACLVVEKGAFFNGRTTMAHPEVALRAEASAQPADVRPHPASQRAGAPS